jgi:hypothetical protein
MRKITTTAMLICCIFLLCVSTGCAEVRVKTHHGWMGPDTWEATDGKVSVSYYNGDCCCVAEKVLENLAALANKELLDWNLMQGKEFRERVLREECKKAQGK